MSKNIVVVTGAGSGLGAETARHLGRQGYQVAVLDINEQQALAVASECGGLGLKCDVSDEDSVSTVLAHIKQVLGTPNVCVNCAGILIGKRAVGKEQCFPMDEFKRVIDVNLNGTFNVSSRVAKMMINDQVQGVVINTASVAAFEGQIGQAAYSASKGGIASMTLPLAREWAQFGIRVVAIAPGIFATPMMTAMPDELQQQLIDHIPYPKRLGEPAEFARCVQHIIDNQMINGTTIRLDGALRLS